MNTIRSIVTGLLAALLVPLFIVWVAITMVQYTMLSSDTYKNALADAQAYDATVNVLGSQLDAATLFADEGDGRDDGDGGVPPVLITMAESLVRGLSAKGLRSMVEPAIDQILDALQNPLAIREVEIPLSSLSNDVRSTIPELLSYATLAKNSGELPPDVNMQIDGDTLRLASMTGEETTVRFSDEAIYISTPAAVLRAAAAVASINAASFYFAVICLVGLGLMLLVAPGLRKKLSASGGLFLAAGGILVIAAVVLYGFVSLRLESVAVSFLAGGALPVGTAAGSISVLIDALSSAARDVINLLLRRVGLVAASMLVVGVAALISSAMVPEKQLADKITKAHSSRPARRPENNGEDGPHSKVQGDE